MLNALISEAAAVVAIGIGVLGTCGYVVRVAARVDAWRKLSQSRDEAIDAIAAGWSERGLNPTGGVAEYDELRETVGSHSDYLASDKRRIERLEHNSEQTTETLGRIDTRLGHIEDVISREDPPHEA